MTEHQVVKIRLTEQINSGTITLKNGCVSLTFLGEMIAKFTNFFRNNFLPQKRLILKTYSNDLTNIFKKNQVVPDYSCDEQQRSENKY